MNRERLEQVIRVMRDIQDDVDYGVKGFGMTQWRAFERDNSESCGTAYCAVGWCMIDPWFNERGLHTDPNGFAPKFGIYGGWTAVEVFFDLTDFEAHVLFGSDAYANPSPMAVQRRVRGFINQ